MCGRTAGGARRTHDRPLRGGAADLNRAIELDPDNDRALGSRGAVLSEMGDNEAAVKDLNRAIELDADYVWAYRVRGEIFRRWTGTRRRWPTSAAALNLEFGDE